MMIICLCQGIREKDVRCAIRQGACTLAKLKSATGAGQGCGSCTQELRYLLHHKNGSACHFHEENPTQGGPLKKTSD